MRVAALTAPVIMKSARRTALGSEPLAQARTLSTLDFSTVTVFPDVIDVEEVVGSVPSVV